MSIREVRTRFHALIDEVENPDILLRFFEIMKQNAKPSKMKLLDTLSSLEKSEVLDAYEESKDEKNLVPSQKGFAKHAKWLKK
jgi:hypothetical protein